MCLPREIDAPRHGHPASAPSRSRTRARCNRARAPPGARRRTSARMKPLLVPHARRNVRPAAHHRRSDRCASRGPCSTTPRPTRSCSSLSAFPAARHARYLLSTARKRLTMHRAHRYSPWARVPRAECNILCHNPHVCPPIRGLLAAADDSLPCSKRPQSARKSAVVRPRLLLVRLGLWLTAARLLGKVWLVRCHQPTNRHGRAGFWARGRLLQLFA